MAEIVIRGVAKRYGATSVLAPFSLDIADGEFVVLVGPSCCGKSTMLKILAGLEPASAGTVLIGGRDVTDLAPGDRDIAMVFQNYALYPHLSVAQNIGLGLRMRGLPRAEIDRRVTEAARMLDVAHLPERRPRMLSGGQRQRVALGRAIVREPQAFLMDEPLSNLDAKLRVHMCAEIGALHRRIGVTTVYVTHDQIEAMTMADRVVIMKDGAIRQIADPDTLFHRPASLFVAGFIGAPGMNFLAVQAAPGEAAVALFGQRAPVAAPADRPAAAGGLIAGLRPEHLALGPGEVSGTVRPRLIESLGSEKYVYFDGGAHAVAGLPGEDERSRGLVARVPHAGALTAGEPLTLSFRAADLHLFDAASGRALV